MQLHLLEHAFDMILEAGEIPHHLFFFELVIQAIAQHNYERAVILINTMAYAPFRVTEKQWTNLFKESEDRISLENLERLLDALGNCDIVSELTVSNLTRSLHLLCNNNFMVCCYFSGRTFCSRAVAECSGSIFPA